MLCSLRDTVNELDGSILLVCVVYSKFFFRKQPVLGTLLLSYVGLDSRLAFLLT